MNILDHIKDNKKDVLTLRHMGRDDLAKTLRLLDLRTGVEVGAAAGHYTECLCKNNPQMIVTAVDAWQPYGGYTDYKKHRTLNGLFNMFKKRMSQYQNHKYIRLFSEDAVGMFENLSLDFVYIDANHDDPWVTHDITQWARKVRKGGIVAGHDYVEVKPEHRPKNWQVKVAVDRYVKNNNIKPLVILKKDSHTNAPSWFFIKP